MAKLPYSRVVRVTLTRNQRFPSRRGFGTVLILTSETSVGKVDATFRTKLYASMSEVAADFGSATETYKAANVAFSQNPSPLQIKIGYVGTPISTIAEVKTGLDLMHEYDSDWYFLVTTAPLRDGVVAQAIIEWIEAKPKLAILDSNDVDTEVLNTSSIAGLNKGLYERTGVFYHTNAATWGGVSLAAWMSCRNFDDADTAYTGKFKFLPGVPVVNLGSAKIQLITGFAPQLGQSTTAGNMANTYVDIGSQPFVVEGSTLKPNVFLDEIHASDWITQRTEEAILGTFLVNDRIEYTDAGLGILRAAVAEVMNVARRAGLIALDRDPTTGEYQPSVVITVPSVFDVPESQRKARIAPAIRCQFRYAGAVHYAVVDYNMTF